MSRITFKNAHKLRAGHTFWRCMIQGDGTVYTEETLLRGKKVTHAFRPLYPGSPVRTSIRIEPKTEYWRGGYFLDDIHGHGASFIAAFTTRKEAMRFKAATEAGMNSAAVLLAQEREAENEGLYYDPYDDYDDGISACGPCDCEDCKPPKHEYSEPMTLGELLRKKLEQMGDVQGTVVPAGVEPLEA